MQIDIVDAVTPGQIDAVRGLFRAYAEWLEDEHGISLKFQDIDAELAGLPGKYAAPKGALRLALGAGGQALGCIALRPYQDSTGEIKRLFVAPAARGAGLGRRLIRDITACGRARSYTRLILDTGTFMTRAQQLYRAEGFSAIPPYSPGPPGVEILHFGANLT